MYIKKIEIENVRGFEKVELDLDRGRGTYAGLTVVAGPNGAGKSTLLKAIALAVAGPSVAAKLEKSFAGWVRPGATAAKVSVQLQRESRDDFGQAGLEPVLLAGGLQWELKGDGPEPSLSGAGKFMPQRGPWAPNPKGWFITAYGPFRRFTAHERRDLAEPTMMARLEALFNEDATFAEAIRWLQGIDALRLEYLESARRDDLETRQAEAELKRKLAHQHQQMLDSIVRLLNGASEQDRLLPDPECRILEVNQRSGIVVERRGVQLPLRSLSDGYQGVIGLIIDIARQLYECYGYFWPIEEDGKHVVAPEGVVLIDEIDAHLHPSWQKRIGFWLKQHFPCVQFIVTTHSPFICQAADAKGLIRLPGPGAGEKADHVPERVYNLVVNGTADDAVMSELFGRERPYSEAAEELREDIAQLGALITEGKATPKQKARHKVLSAKLSQTPSAQVEQAILKLTERIHAKKGAKR